MSTFLRYGIYILIMIGILHNNTLLSSAPTNNQQQIDPNIPHYINQKTKFPYNSFGLLKKNLRSNIPINHTSFVGFATTPTRINYFDHRNALLKKKMLNNTININTYRSEYFNINLGNASYTTYVMDNVMFAKHHLPRIKNPYLNFIGSGKNHRTFNIFLDVLDNVKYNFVTNVNYNPINNSKLDSNNNIQSTIFVHEFSFLYNQSSTSIQLGRITDKSFFQTYEFPEKNLLEISFTSVTYAKELRKNKFYVFSQYIQGRHRISNENISNTQSKSIKNFGMFLKNMFSENDRIAIIANVNTMNHKNILSIKDMVLVPNHLTFEYIIPLYNLHEIKAAYTKHEEGHRVMLNYALL